MDKKTLYELTSPISKPSIVPELTDAIIESAIPLLLEVEENSGYLGIAMTLGATQNQIREIHKGMKLRIIELKEV